MGRRCYVGVLLASVLHSQGYFGIYNNVVFSQILFFSLNSEMIRTERGTLHTQIHCQVYAKYLLGEYVLSELIIHLIAFLSKPYKYLTS